MARIYAGILGPLAMLTSLANGAIHAREADTILFAAWCSLVVFAAVGAVVGWIAGQIVEESVQVIVAAELAARESAEQSQPAAGEDVTS